MTVPTDPLRDRAPGAPAATRAARQTGRPVVSVSHLSKKFSRDLRSSQWYGLRDIAREFLRRGANTHPAGLRRGEFWALRDVSFDIGPGESLAVVGANGAGKSTLLKLLYGLIKPDAGRVRVVGRVAALIELGTGFNPVLSGRENVHVNAAMLGLPRRRVDLLMDEIADFAELHDFMDTPLQHYSSGMQARLSYAVAAHLKPDVFLVDEVLAVGDMAFQRKCINHMKRYLDGGGSLILVSHSPYQIQAVCQRGILLEAGQVTYSGTATETLSHHFEAQHRGTGATSPASRSPALDEDRPVVIESVTAEPVHGDVIRTGEDMRLTLRYHALGSPDVIWGFNVWTGDQWVCVTGSEDTRIRALSPGKGELRCVVPGLPLVAGSYLVKAAILDPGTRFPLATYGWRDAPCTLRVHPRPTQLNNAFRAVSQLMLLDVSWE